ncbi:hypothetical protein [Saccharibacillus endophyticus]|uniref:Uncharacterized protein n=1 Tax=Saccharibacillus endophyticus TaxID=2060666 RepID=A0ABQ1ZUK4_9BACL|nr:hypothetical protein [Saccharibacillus endophyticus]GGH79757.1 hypothetical protein GCM10007362_27030 [Saccharibacillus endophyticus]
MMIQKNPRENLDTVARKVSNGHYVEPRNPDDLSVQKKLISNAIEKIKLERTLKARS